MKKLWVWAGLVGCLCLAAPAKAGNLTSWRFNLDQNHLRFSTQEDVQPRAQWIANSPAAVDNSATQIEEILVTADGLFIRTTGASPEIKIERRRDRHRRRENRTLDFTVENAILSTQLRQQAIAINRYGISQLELQTDDGKNVKIRLT